MREGRWEMVWIFDRWLPKPCGNPPNLHTLFLLPTCFAAPSDEPPLTFCLIASSSHPFLSLLILSFFNLLCRLEETPEIQPCGTRINII